MKDQLVGGLKGLQKRGRCLIPSLLFSRLMMSFPGLPGTQEIL
jgi:hypothetical protein